MTEDVRPVHYFEPKVSLPETHLFQFLCLTMVKRNVTRRTNEKGRRFRDSVRILKGDPPKTNGRLRSSLLRQSSHHTHFLSLRHTSRLTTRPGSPLLYSRDMVDPVWSTPEPGKGVVSHRDDTLSMRRPRGESFLSSVTPERSGLQGEKIL